MTPPPDPARPVHHRPASGTGPLPRVLVLLVLAVAALVPGVLATLSDPPSPLLAVLVTAALAAGLCLQHPLNLGAQRVRVDGAYEAALVVALGVGAAAFLLPAVTVVVLAREAALRKPLLRAAASTGVVVVPLAGGLAVQALLPSGPGVLAWPGIVVAVAVVALLNEVLLAWVLAAVTGTPVRVQLRRDARSSLRALAVNLALGLAVLAAVLGRRWELLVLLPSLGLLLFRRTRAELQRDTVSDALPRMVLAAQRLDGEDDDELVREVLSRTADMFGLRRVELVLLGWPGEGDRTCAWVDGVVSTRAGRASGGGAGVLSRALVTGSTLPVALGELRLHFPTAQELTDAEEQVLTTLVMTCSSALARSRSHREQALAARRDPLTGLANRLALQEQLDARLPLLLDAAAEDPSAVGAALLLVDLDHFKEVNDTLGHSAGDRVLVELSARLLRAVRPDDLVVRLGGDEFALLLVDVADREQARELAEAVLRRMAAPVVVAGLELPVEASVGVALAPTDGTCGDDLLRRADVAMYRAKDERNAVVVYDPAMDSGREQQLSLLGQLQTALREDRLVVHYQPVVALADGRVVSAEALVRWDHPDQGLLGPGAFVPAAERTELVVPLTLAVLERAVAEAVSWRTPDGHPVSLAVNLSPRCLLDRALPSHVAAVLARHGLPGRRLVLEITETLALSELEVVEEVLEALRALGVRLSLDDFGTGYSSMSALRRLAVHEVKLDRGFVADAVSSRSARAVVEATVVLAHGLGVPVVGEGVETEEQLALLRAAGCDRVQGYLLGRPVPADEFRARLRAPALRR